jgi:ATP-binding cassette, subfamily C (CFTR/MRP), member 1
MMSSLVEAIVSVKRLSTFFNEDELQSDARTLVVKDDLQEGDEVKSVRPRQTSVLLILVTWF